MSTPTRGGNFYATTTDTKADVAKKFVLRNLLVIVAIIVFLMTYFVLHGISSSRDDGLASQRSQIVSLRSQLALTQDQVHSKQGDAVREATSGMDLTHKDSDDAAMIKLMKLALTWDGLSAYLDARTQVIKAYGFAEDSQFMSVFMPGQKEGAVRTAPSGRTYSAFDKDMKSEFSDYRSYVTAINSEVYSYFAVVTMRVASGSGASSQNASIMLSYDMIDGKPANLDAYTVPGGVDVSG